MRALAHPIRVALLEALAVHGPLTATRAGELVGASPSSCSFHLRTLARHKFVEETGDGVGRQRPWRLVNIGMWMSGPYEDPGTRTAANALSDVFIDRQLRRLFAARESRDRLPAEWADAGTESESFLWLTPAELRAMNDEVLAVLLRHRERLTDPATRPQDAKPVELLYFAYRTDFDPGGAGVKSGD